MKSIRCRLKLANGERATIDVPLKTGNEAFGLFVMLASHDLGITKGVEQDIQSVLDFKAPKPVPAHLQPSKKSRRSGT